MPSPDFPGKLGLKKRKMIGSRRSQHLGRLLGAASLVLVAVAAAGCNTTQMSDAGALRATAAVPSSEADWRHEADVAGASYRADPNNSQAAIRYAQALRATGERAQAAAVLEQACMRRPTDRSLLGAYGRALADAGNYHQAFDVLGRAHTPDQPDWHILSVQGAVLDQLGRHDEARRYYASALKIVPDEPSVLSNLGLSYALSKDLGQAESTLRRAVSRPDADRRVRQNLALVVGLEGRFEEAENIARADLPPEEAAANIAYLRQLLSRQAGAEGPKPMRNALASSGS
jgi:Flp pilus assembly protein TadD